jgi:hypothetical protein
MHWLADLRKQVADYLKQKMSRFAAVEETSR